MKHRILIEFSADTLPDDFLDQIAGRVYGHPAVDKKECTAAFVGDVLKDAERYQWLREANPDEGPSVMESRMNNWGKWFNVVLHQEELDAAIDAAKDTQ